MCVCVSVCVSVCLCVYVCMCVRVSEPLGLCSTCVSSAAPVDPACHKTLPVLFLRMTKMSVSQVRRPRKPPVLKMSSVHLTFPRQY